MSARLEVPTLDDILELAPNFRSRRTPRQNRRGLGRIGKTAAQHLVLAEGDSLTHGFPDYSTSYPIQLQTLLGSAYNVITTEATDGQRIDEMDTQFWGNDFTYRSDAYKTNIYVLMGGTNDIFQGASALTIELRLLQLCDRAYRNGWRVLMCTLTKSNDFTAGMETIRQDVNTWIKANWATCADGLVDLDAIPELSNPSDPVYYADNTHRTAAGYGLVAAAVKTQVLALPPLAFTSPGRISGCVAWFRPDPTSVTLSGSLCTGITDRTGLTSGATQVAGSAPTYTLSDNVTSWQVPGTVFFRPSLAFANGKSLVNTTQNIITAGAARSVITVAYANTLNPGGGAHFCMGRSGTYLSCLTQWAGDGSVRGYYDGSSFGRFASDNGNVKKWTHWKFSGAGNAFAASQNGAALSIFLAKNQTSESGSAGYILGSDPTNGAYFDGNIVDILVFDSVIAEGTNSPIRRYLARYGFAGG